MGIVERLLKKSAPKDPNAKLVAIGYARVSTQMQVNKDFSSIAAQKIHITEFVKNNPRYVLEDIYEEPGRSGKNNNRAALAQLMARVERGGVDVVLAVRLDRVSRSQKGYYELEDFLANHETRLLYTNDITPDDTPAGRFTTGMRIGMSELERNITVQRQGEKYLISLKQGLYPAGMAPFGYRRGDTFGILEIDENESGFVKKIFKLFLDGQRPSEIADTMNEQYGAKPMKILKSGRILNPRAYTENFIRKVLRNPIYAGYVAVELSEKEKGTPVFQKYDGKHKPLVDRKIWEKVQIMLNSMAKNIVKDKTRNNKKYLLKGLMKCSCGAQMTVSRCGKVHKDGSIYAYYTCTRKIHFRKESPCKTTLALSVIEGVVFVVLGKIFSEYTLGKKYEEPTEYEQSLKTERAGLITKKSRLDTKLSKMISLICELSDNPVIKDKARKDADNLAKEIASVAERINFINKELELLTKAVNIDKEHVKSQVGRIDLLKDELCFSEKKEIIDNCIEKLVLHLSDRISPFKKEFVLTVIPKEDFKEQIGTLEVRFNVDTSMGGSVWSIKSPFKYECGFVKLREQTTERIVKKQPSHFIHDIIRWRKMKEKMTYKELEKVLKIKKSMIYRKILLLEKLSDDVKIILMNMKERKELELMSFRFLWDLSRKPQGEQAALLNKMLRG